MRICFDRLCFATKRPANTEHSDSESPHSLPPDRLQNNNEQSNKLNVITTKPPASNIHSLQPAQLTIAPWLVSNYSSNSTSNGNSHTKKNTTAPFGPRTTLNGLDPPSRAVPISSTNLNGTQTATATPTPPPPPPTNGNNALYANLADLASSTSTAITDSLAASSATRQTSTVIIGKKSTTTNSCGAREDEEYSQFNNSTDSGIGSSLRGSSSRHNRQRLAKTNNDASAPSENEVRERSFSDAHFDPKASTATSTISAATNVSTVSSVAFLRHGADNVTANGIIASKDTSTAYKDTATCAQPKAASAEEIETNGEQSTNKIAATMQQEPNANFQFQPDLGLVNSNNLPALTGLGSQTGAIRTLTLPLQQDVIAQTFIYGTVPSSAAQHINSLQQQELQLQHRYHQLQQLQAQTQGLFLNTNAPGTVAAAAAAAAVAQGGTPFVVGTPPQLYTNTPTAAAEFCAAQQQKLLSDQMQGLCIAGGAAATPNANAVPAASTTINSLLDSSATMNILNNSYVPTTPQEERFMQIIQAKEMKIQEMQRALQQKDTEIAELKSHLDKFQSVFPFSRHASTATTPGAGVQQQRKSGQAYQRQRAQGISAEPQSESSVLLEPGALPKYDKDER
ncbi:endochitinase A-like [Rhagoletis pomonella]|uniref:endochitinase A-like n=1 Tax=Rhagoletis pomonella TaxID=28610 RepID=UPI001784AC27|nr:endochitinase A-like [Rhagoletis pomonella]